MRVSRCLLAFFMTATVLVAADSSSKFIGQKPKIKRFKIKIKVQEKSGWDEKALQSIEWETVKGKHFVVYFAAQKKTGNVQDISALLRGEERFAGRVLRRAEEYYGKIADGLGYQRRSGFWTWKNRAKIYVYPSRIVLRKSVDRPGWSKGSADYTNKTISGHRSEGEEVFLTEVLPHELGHLIFRDFIGFEGEVPLWLDEGVAQLQEGGGARRRVTRRKSLEILWKDRLLPLKDLTATDGSYLRERMTVRSVWEFYIQALSLVDFMIKKGGKTRFEKFCRQLRDGKSLDDALRFSYPKSIRSTEELEKKWVLYLTKER